MTDEYPRDEFDEIAESGGPVGVHRSPRPWWWIIVVPVVVFVVAGLLAFGVARFLWDTGSGSESTATPSATATAEPTESASATAEPSASASATTEPSETAEPEPSETAEPEPVISYDAPITVLNGTGVSGLAGEQAGILTDAGFTDVSAANLTGSPSANVVIYDSEERADTAQEVADLLGIDAVEFGDTETLADIEVQIVSQ
ncbi:LytR C-terminal domain-containing protein [Demequina rhizosphaerae]|uniref:LytR C-terminal domain-containing protein n=1 Tax=Demequina rhizosphaerae TaxID=1638985 RepID=UPI0007854B6E|nr:LytR C-terminal domain-containing protein [Demequina rhizosphaerae]